MGQDYVIETTAGDFDTYLYLLDDSCAVIAQDDDAGDGALSLINFSALDNKTYTIVVTSFSPSTEGSYTLELNPVGPETACDDGLDDDSDGDIDCADSDCATDSACVSSCALGDCCYGDTLTFTTDPDSYSGSLSSGDAQDGPRGAGYYFDDVEFTAVMGQEHVLEVTAGDFDTYIYLLDDSCTVIAEDDDGGAGTLSRLVFTPTDNRTYTIAVSSFSSGTTGSYTLELNPVTVETVCDDGLDDDSDGDVDCEDSDCATDSACVSSCGLGDCCYGDTLTFDTLPDSYSGTLSGSDATDGPRGSGYSFDDIEFTAVAGTTYTIEFDSADFDSYMYLLDDGCTVIDSDDDDGVGLLSQIVFTATDNKTYTVIATTFDSSTLGDYVLTID